MAEPDLSFIRPDVSLDEIRPVDRRRLIAMLNGSLIRIGEWLGEIGKKGEESLMKAERRLMKAEEKLILLENKLLYIQLDEGNGNTVSPSMITVEEKKEDTKSSEENVVEVKKEEDAIEVKEDQNEIEGDKLLIKDDPRYSKYFKMVKMGVQEEAVKLKMISEGIDPSILSNPMGISIDGVKEKEEEDNSSNESIGSFTDSD